MHTREYATYLYPISVIYVFHPNIFQYSKVCFFLKLCIDMHTLNLVNCYSGICVKQMCVDNYIRKICSNVFIFVIYMLSMFLLLLIHGYGYDHWNPNALSLST